MVCTKCGAELKEADLFCLNCGQEVQIVPDYSPFEELVIKNLAEAQSKHYDSEKAKEAQSNQTDHDKNDQTTDNSEEQNTQSLHFVKRKNKKNDNREQVNIKVKSHIVRYLSIVAFFIFITFIGYRTIQRMHDSSYEYQYEQAQEDIIAGEYNSALTHLKRAVEIDKTSIDARIEMAQIYENTKELPLAILTLQEALGIDAQNADVVKQLLQLYSDYNYVPELQAYLKQIEGTNMAQKLGEYFLNKPSFSVVGGTYDKYIAVELTAQSNRDIYYTVDGSKPTSSAIKYSGQIRLRGGTTTIRAVSVDSLGDMSAESIEAYTVNSTVPDNPVIKPASGVYSVPQPIVISVPANCTVYYTWDKTEPTDKSNKYQEPLDMPLGKHVLSVVAIDNNGIVSNTIQSNYSLDFTSNFTIDQAYNIVVQHLGNQLVDDKGAFQLECNSAIEIGGYNLYIFEKVYGKDGNGNKLLGSEKYAFDVLTAETFVAVRNSAGGYDLTPY